MTGSNPTCQSLANSTKSFTDLLAAIKGDEYMGELYGISNPTPPVIWNPRFSRLEDWLQARKDERQSSIEARHSLLLILQQQRVNSVESCNEYMTDYYRDHYQEMKDTPASGWKSWDMEAINCLIYERKKLVEVHRSIAPAADERTSLRFQAAILAETCTVIELSTMPPAIAKGIVTDQAMTKSIAVLQRSLPQIESSGNLFNHYYYLMMVATGQWQRYRIFESRSHRGPPQATACLRFFLEADKIYSEIRQDRSISEPSIAFSAKSELADNLTYYNISNLALNATYEAYTSQKSENGALDEGDKGVLAEFLEWTQRSKGRGLTEALGFGAHIPERMMIQARRCSKASEYLDTERELVDKIRVKQLEGVKSATLVKKLRRARRRGSHRRTCRSCERNCGSYDRKCGRIRRLKRSCVFAMAYP
jgi:hypothetical protein